MYEEPEKDETLILENWIHDKEYFITYPFPSSQELAILDKLIEEDLNDKQFLRLRRQILDGLFIGYLTDNFVVSDYLNTDLRMSLSLGSPLLIHPQLKSIWAHKFERMIKQSIAIIPSLEYPEKIQALSYFLKSREAVPQLIINTDT